MSDQEEFSPFEVRVLAVLAEKEAITPDNYPLSINALTNGCNQLTSRDPVMELSESTVHDVLQGLKQRKLVSEVQQAGARVVKYEHRMRIKWSLEPDKLCVLTLLMLRGVQTAGELRSRSTRMHEFASLADVEKALQFLQDKYPPLVVKLPLAPGTKEVRYGHTLCGEAALQQEMLVAERSSPAQLRSSLEQEVAALRAEVAELRQQFADFKKQFE
ncbi:YceH family protein [Massilia sp. W12]|uniref:YceH family protein n=1 Tax=Massilia sp. W12 TaxID=3126507 RepID=UPI0030CC17E0